MLFIKSLTLGVILLSTFFMLTLWSSAYFPSAKENTIKPKASYVTGVRSYLDKLGNTWDSFHYTQIAERGYKTEPRQWAFFPLFPLEIRAIQKVTSISFQAANVLAGAINLIFFISVFALFIREYLAHKKFNIPYMGVVATALVLPFTFFLYIGYTEGLFCGLLYLIFYLIFFKRESRWIYLAPVCTYLISLTRSTGVLVVVAIAFLLSIEIIKTRPLFEYFKSIKFWIPVIAVVTGILGLLTFMYYGYTQTGDFWISKNVQVQYWYRGQTWNPIKPVIDNWNSIQIGIQTGDGYKIYCVNKADCLYGLSYTMFSFGVIAVLILLSLVRFCRDKYDLTLFLFSLLCIYLPLTTDSYSSINRYMIIAPFYLVFLPVSLHVIAKRDFMQSINLGLAMIQAFLIIVFSLHYWIV